jgi:xylan 1,4-beta-xylosidase
VLDLVNFGHKNDCEPDYIITHIYNNDSEVAALSPFDGPQEDKASTSPHFAAGVMRGVRRELDVRDFKGEVHWNEWGRSWLPHDPVRESANEAAFVVKTMSEVSQLADYFAYWCLSDVYDQLGYGRETFHGNYGLLNLQGLRKPAYHAFQLLSLLEKSACPFPAKDLTH